MRGAVGKANAGYPHKPLGRITMEKTIDYEINNEMGECYLFMGDYDKAADCYRKAASAPDCGAAPYMGLATIAIQNGEYDNALTLYKKALAKENNAKAHCGIGLVQMQLGHNEEAFDSFAETLKKLPSNMVALNCLVRTGYQLQRVEELLPYLEAALDSTEQTEAVRVALAGCFMYLGRNDEARRHLEIVLGSNPENVGAKEMFDTVAA